MQLMALEPQSRPASPLDTFSLNQIVISQHAIDRFIQRVNGQLTIEEARSVIYGSLEEAHQKQCLSFCHTSTRLGWVTTIASDSFGVIFVAAFVVESLHNYGLIDGNTHLILTTVMDAPYMRMKLDQGFKGDVSELKNELCQARSNYNAAKKEMVLLKRDLNDYKQRTASLLVKNQKLLEKTQDLRNQQDTIYQAEQKRGKNASVRQLRRMEGGFEIYKPGWIAKNGKFTKKVKAPVSV
jgi:hypothetical protein